MRWEYLTRTRQRSRGPFSSGWKDDVEKELAKLGDQGWELVAVSACTDSANDVREVWAFKRPRS